MPSFVFILDHESLHHMSSPCRGDLQDLSAVAKRWLKKSSFAAFGSHLEDASRRQSFGHNGSLSHSLGASASRQLSCIGLGLTRQSIGQAALMSIRRRSLGTFLPAKPGAAAAGICTTGVAHSSPIHPIRLRSSGAEDSSTALTSLAPASATAPPHLQQSASGGGSFLHGVQQVCSDSLKKASCVVCDIHLC